MLSLLDPRLWLAVILAVALSCGAGYLKGRKDGTTIAMATANAEKAAAIETARNDEKAHQRRVDDATKLAAAREIRARSDLASANRERDGLQRELADLAEFAATSRAAAERAAAVTAELLGDCSRAYLDMAEAAQRADSESRTLRDAWPR